MDYQFDVFLCHNSQDKPAVREISRQLKEYQLKTWLDEEQLRPGDSTWQKSLQTQINQIRAAAVFIGQSGLGPWQEEEVEAFLLQFKKRKCPVIPVLLKEASAEIEIPPFLEIRTWVDFRHPETKPFEKLIWAITGRKPLLLIISEVSDKSLQLILNENNLNLSEKLAKDFLDILSSIDDYDLFSKILDDPRIRIQTSGSDIDKYSKILKDNLRDNDNKFGELIRFFLIHYPNLDLILTFANLLKSNLQETDNIYIKKWIDEIQKNSANSLSFSSSEEFRQTAINAHLMIVVSNWSAGEYRLNSFLLSDVSDFCHDIVEIINGHQQDDKGFVCKSLNDIKKRSLQCINESQKILNSEKKIKKISVYHLTIELFLTFQHICEAVDLWELPNDEEPIGIIHRVVVRSYERICNPDYENRLNEVWFNFRQSIAQSDDKVNILDKFEELRGLDKNWKKWPSQIRKAKKIGLKIFCSIPSQSDHEKIFKCICQSGLPVALWSRNEIITDADMELINNLISVNNLRDTSVLFEEIRSWREDAFSAEDGSENDIGNHLGILFDNPERLPPFEAVEMLESIPLAI